MICDKCWGKINGDCTGKPDNELWCDDFDDSETDAEDKPIKTEVQK